MTKPLKALIDKPFVWFDLDDTIWDMTGNSCIALAGIFDGDPDVRRAFGADGLQQWLDVYHRINKDLWVRYENGTIDRATLRLERFALPLQEAGIDRATALEAAAHLDGDYLRLLGDCPGTIVGAHRAVRAVLDAGIPVGIVSNGFREVQYRKLASGGFDGWFDPIVLSDDAGVNKPDPEFFRIAAERAGVDPCQCVIVGDNMRSDILGALNAGWGYAYWLVDPRSGVAVADIERMTLTPRCTPFSSMLHLPAIMGLADA